MTPTSGIAVSGSPAMDQRAAAVASGIAKVRDTSVTEVRKARDSHDATIDRRVATANSGTKPARADQPQVAQPRVDTPNNADRPSKADRPNDADRPSVERQAHPGADARAAERPSEPPPVARFAPEAFSDTARTPEPDVSQRAEANRAYAATLRVFEGTPDADDDAAPPAPAAEPDFGQRIEAERAYETGQKVAAAAERAIGAVFDTDDEFEPVSEVF